MKIKFENFDNLSGIFTTAVAIISMVTTCNLTNSQIEQTQQHFEKILERDSIVSIEEEKLISLQISYTEKQNLILEAQNKIIKDNFRADSLLNILELKIAKKQLFLNEKEQDNKDQMNLNKFNNTFLDFVFNYNIKDDELIKMENEEIGRWFLKVNKMMQMELTNPILLKDSAVLQRWRELIESTKIFSEVFLRSQLEKNDKKNIELKLTAYRDTSKGLKMIYNRINEVMGYDKLMGVD